MVSKEILQKKIEEEQKKLELQKISRAIRKGRFRTIDDCVSYIVSKVVGLGAFITGGLETLDPEILPVVIQEPTFAKRTSALSQSRKSHSFDQSSAMILIDTTAINTDSYLLN